MSSPEYRLVYFLQAHNIDGTQEYLSMLPLGKPSRHTTHICLAAFHLNYTKDNGAGNHAVYLNEEIYNQGLNVTVWNEAAELRKQGISIFAQISPDAWEVNHLGGTDVDFEKGYRLFADMIRDKGVDGVDFNVEPHDPLGIKGIDNDGIVKMIRKLKAEFPHLLITMCPGGGELLGEGALSHVRYLALNKAVGDEIAWYNFQTYNGWGDLSLGEFERYVEAGYAPRKLVPLLLGQTSGTKVGWLSGEEIKQGLRDIITKYPDMGGVGCWDWNGATLTGKRPVEHPEEWTDFVVSCLYPPTD